MRNKNLYSLIIWIMAPIIIGDVIGYLTKPDINTWYETLNISTITPANYVFPIAWTILYGIIGACGWLIWRSQEFPNLIIIKTLYIIHFILNWSWTPLFFHYHLIGPSLIVLLIMDIVVGSIICISYQKIREACFLMIPYLSWIILASYLNFYIWFYN